MGRPKDNKLPKIAPRKEPGKQYEYTLVRHFWEGTRMRRRVVSYTTTRNFQHAQALMEAFAAISRDRGEDAFQVTYHIYMSEVEETPQERRVG